MARSLKIVVQEYLDLAQQQDEIAEALLLLRERLETLLAQEPELKYQCEGGTFALVPSPTKVRALVHPTLLDPRYQNVTADVSALRKAMMPRLSMIMLNGRLRWSGYLACLN